MSDLTVTLIQSNLHWHDPAANYAELDRHIASIPIRTDLVVLPEMFTTGFSMEAPTQAEPMDGPTLPWMRQHAATLNAVVCGSVMMREGEAYFNRLLWVRPDGTFSYYDKHHLFTFAGEQHVFTPGQQRLLEEWRGWRICPLVCYDLRFPVWSRNRPEDPYDLLLYTANWPTARRSAWNALLRARAIENVAYTIGVNRVGTDGNRHEYAGDSALIDMRGDYLLEAGNHEASVTRTIRRSELEAFRQRFPALHDADPFELLPVPKA
ncbi:amidohydrolase [Hymenobacter sp. BT175]|uniref:amidohydrolase n=1 Tax=Hymenobacter translucens TaxID=2886507 RepID=UPI001D0DC15C|nr:amidohydrolase [Hymenobacter translucens]MCC2547284.1 amidohydrolase [Hymenobacter translucens]